MDFGLRDQNDGEERAADDAHESSEKPVELPAGNGDEASRPASVFRPKIVRDTQGGAFPGLSALAAFDIIDLPGEPDPDQLQIRVNRDLRASEAAIRVLVYRSDGQLKLLVRPNDTKVTAVPGDLREKLQDIVNKVCLASNDDDRTAVPQAGRQLPLEISCGAQSAGGSQSEGEKSFEGDEGATQLKKPITNWKKNEYIELDLNYIHAADAGRLAAKILTKEGMLPLKVELGLLPRKLVVEALLRVFDKMNATVHARCSEKRGHLIVSARDICLRSHRTLSSSTS